MINPKQYKKRDCIETLIDKRKDAIEQKRLALAALEEAEAKERELMLSIQAWAESYGFDIRVLDESDEVPEPELVITDWRDLRVGDVIVTNSSDGEVIVCDTFSGEYRNVAYKGSDGLVWLTGEWKFIRRPSK